MNLSAWAFIFGICGAVRKVPMPSAVKPDRPDLPPDTWISFTVPAPVPG